MDFLRRHEEDARRALRDGMRGVRALAPFLVQRIADPRTLRLSWDFLACKGGHAAGPNGRRYTDYTSSEAWDLCKCLASAILNGTYRPGPERVIWIDKASGKGKRPIVLLNVPDRAVQRGIALILQPVLDPLLDRNAFGYRPRLGHLHALALAEHLTVSQRRRIWVAEDVRDAFLHVPLPRLLQTIEKVLPDSKLLGLLERVLPGENLPGLRQGGALSPLMMNWYLHWFLDRPWRRDCPRTPLIRVADDLLAVCHSKKEAREAYDHLGHLLVPAAMPLKGTRDTAIHDLANGQAVEWLGFAIRQVERVLAAGIVEDAWKSLKRHLALAHTKSDSPLRAYYLVKQWLNHRGPCYAWTDRAEACQKIIDCAHQQGFEEVPTILDLQNRWQLAYARWCRLRKQVRQSYSQAALCNEAGRRAGGQR
jgi:hypothetical protein